MKASITAAFYLFYLVTLVNSTSLLDGYYGIEIKSSYVEAELKMLYRSEIQTVLQETQTAITQKINTHTDRVVVNKLIELLYKEENIEGVTEFIFGLIPFTIRNLIELKSWLREAKTNLYKLFKSNEHNCNLEEWIYKSIDLVVYNETNNFFNNVTEGKLQTLYDKIDDDIKFEFHIKVPPSKRTAILQEVLKKCEENDLGCDETCSRITLDLMLDQLFYTQDMKTQYIYELLVSDTAKKFIAKKCLEDKTIKEEIVKEKVFLQYTATKGRPLDTNKLDFLERAIKELNFEFQSSTLENTNTECQKPIFPDILFEPEIIIVYLSLTKLQQKEVMEGVVMENNEYENLTCGRAMVNQLMTMLYTEEDIEGRTQFLYGLVPESQKGFIEGKPWKKVIVQEIYKLFLRNRNIISFQRFVEDALNAAYYTGFRPLK